MIPGLMNRPKRRPGGRNLMFVSMTSYSALRCGVSRDMTGQFARIFSSGHRHTHGRRQGFGAFGTRAFLATAGASTSYAAYYCMTALFFGSVAPVHGDNDDNKAAFRLLNKVEDAYGIEYKG